MLAFLFTIALVASTMAAPSPSETSDFSKGLQKFSVDLYQKCVEGKNENAILSPYSVGAVLAFAAQGAAGTTQRKMFDGLHLTGTKEQVADGFHNSFSALTRSIGNSTLEIANKAYIMQGHQIKAAFKQVVENKFNAEVESVNFAATHDAAKTINTWVEEKTHDKIHDLIDAESLGSDTRAVLVNAIYFKGSWKHKFNKDATQTRPFWTSPDKSVDVEFMHQKEQFGYGAFDELDCTALLMKYNGSDVSFLILLPNKKDGLAALEQKLSTVDFGDLTNRMAPQEVQIAIPKFKIESKFDLKEPLEKLGFAEIFSDNANFGELIESGEPLKVSKVVQKAFIEVNEEGAEAAAATGLEIQVESLVINPAPIPVFVADHPFHFAIVQHESIKQFHTLLFTGHFVGI